MTLLGSLSVLSWDSYFTNILQKGNGMVVVLHSTCGDHYTYRSMAQKPSFGEGDLHDTSYDYMEVDTEFAPFVQHNYSDTKEHCEYGIRIYPSSDDEDSFTSNKPVIYTTVVVLLFILDGIRFLRPSRRDAP
jgi:hypothetical protein